MRYRPQTDKDQLHISFYSIDGKQQIEYVPKDFGWLRYLIRNYYFRFLLRYNIPLYYWNIRGILISKHRKAEDLRFIHHVKTEHDGKPKLWRERLHYAYASMIYDQEYERFAEVIFNHYETKKPIDDPYIKAYAKKWSLKRSAQWRTLYHGVDMHEYEALLDEVAADHKRYFRKNKKY